MANVNGEMGKPGGVCTCPKVDTLPGRNGAVVELHAVKCGLWWQPSDFE